MVSPIETSGELDQSKRVHIFDTTLRDGEQSPGISLNTAEKLEIATQLGKLGVDVIEAGFPITSPGDFVAVEQIARKVEGPIICGLARTHKGDIDAAWGAIKDAVRPRIHTFISTSDIHLEHQLRTDRQDVLGQARAGVAMAKAYCDDVEFSPMDATRSEIEFVAEVVSAAVEEGATVINIPDTVGYTTPDEYAEYFRKLYKMVPALQGVEMSVHCHDDLGMAVANSYAGVLAGARQVESAVNGIGERAGNASLEEIAMLINVRGGEQGFHTGINTREIARTSRMVTRHTGYQVQPNKAIVGRNAFAHESGIHQDGVLKERTTYEIMAAEDVGLESNSIVLGKHSGRHALRDALEQLGFELDGNALNAAFRTFKDLADRKKMVTAMDLEAIVSDETRSSAQVYELVGHEYSGSSGKNCRAKVTVKLPNEHLITVEATGDGPVDAMFNALQVATHTNCSLKNYTVDPVTEGEDAIAEATVVLKNGGSPRSGTAISTDIVDASGHAYVRALSLMGKREPKLLVDN